MALDRLLTAYPSLSAATSRTGGRSLWARRQLRSELISTGQTGFYNTDNLIARESVIFRMRYVRDLTLRTVLVSQEGDVYLLESIAEVGRNRFLDVACTTYQGLTAADDVTRWPYITDPYTAPAGWGLVKDGAPVQNIVIYRWETPSGGNPFRPEYTDPTQSNRQGSWSAQFRAANDGYSGTIIETAIATVTRSGVRGTMTISSGPIGIQGGWTVQPEDAFIPITNVWFAATWNGVTAPGLGVGSAMRVLSQEELDG